MSTTARERRAVARSSTSNASEPPRGHASVDESVRPSAEGRIVHSVIAELVLERARPTLTDIARAVSRESAPLGLTGPQLRAVHTSAISRVSVYFRYFVNPNHVCEHVEFDIVGRRVDLVWRTTETKYMVDEIKSGQVTRKPTHPGEQVEAYLGLGRLRWGHEFLGVRVCLLRSPMTSVLFGPEGDLKPLILPGRSTTTLAVGVRRPSFFREVLS